MNWLQKKIKTFAVIRQSYKNENFADKYNCVWGKNPLDFVAVFW